MPMFMTNKVLAVVLSVPISDIFSVVVTVACFVPGFCQKMNNYVKAMLLNISKSISPEICEKNNLKDHGSFDKIST